MEMSRREQTLLQLKNIVLQTMNDVQVNIYLFGSWARNEEKRTSDIDIGFLPIEKIPIKKWVELRDKIEESHLAYSVDVVDLSKVDSSLVKVVVEEGIVWKDCTKGFKVQIGH